MESQYSPYYADLVQHPALGKYRKFLDLNSWILDEDIADILEQKQCVDAVIAELWRSDASVPDTTVTGCHRIHMPDSEKYKEAIAELKKRVRTYDDDLLRSSRIVKLPGHSSFYSKRLKKYEGLFKDGIFIPTGADASMYEDQDHCGIDEPPGTDPTTTWILNNCDWIDKHILRHVRSLWGCVTRRKPSTDPEFDSDMLMTIMDVVACFLMPILFTATLLVLNSIRSPNVCIAVIGGFCFLFMLLIQLMAVQPTRGQLWAFSVAFFAVASGFFGSAGNNKNHCQT